MSNTQRHLSRLEKLALRSTHLWLSTKRQKMLPMMPRPAMTGTATPSIQNCRSLFQQRASQPPGSPVSPMVSPAVDPLSAGCRVWVVLATRLSLNRLHSSSSWEVVLHRSNTIC